MGYLLNSSDSDTNKNAYRNVNLHEKQDGGNAREWVQYIITNSTDTANFINGEDREEDTIIKFYVNGVSKSATYESDRGRNLLEQSPIKKRLQENLLV